MCYIHQRACVLSPTVTLEYYMPIWLSFLSFGLVTKVVY